MTLYGMPVTRKNVGFMVDVAVHRMWFWLTRTRNPSSTPFISGDTFRSLADHVFDADQKLQPGAVKKWDSVFVDFPHLQSFFKKIHPKISARYILITHNGDTSIDSASLRFLDDKILHWFSQNVTVHHPKITPIPIGLENLDYYNHGVPSFFSELQKKQTPKLPSILYGFSIHTNPDERQPAYDYISHHPVAKKIPERLNGYEYLRTLNKYQFVLSPPGNGPDCIRTWEALYLGVVPIVKKSVATEYFASLGLPLWIVTSWRELDGYTPEKLQQKYLALTQDIDQTALYIPYWKARISFYA
jgi:hypothetical protein